MLFNTLHRQGGGGCFTTAGSGPRPPSLLHCYWRCLRGCPANPGAACDLHRCRQGLHMQHCAQQVSSDGSSSQNTVAAAAACVRGRLLACRRWRASVGAVCLPVCQWNIKGRRSLFHQITASQVRRGHGRLLQRSVRLQGTAAAAAAAATAGTLAATARQACAGPRVVCSAEPAELQESAVQAAWADACLGPQQACCPNLGSPH